MLIRQFLKNQTGKILKNSKRKIVKKENLQIFFFTMETVEIDNNVKIEVPWEDDLLCNEIVATKGQLILKCPFGFFKSSKKSTRFFPGFLP